MLSPAAACLSCLERCAVRREDGILLEDDWAAAFSFRGLELTRNNRVRVLVARIRSEMASTAEDCRRCLISYLVVSPYTALCVVNTKYKAIVFSVRLPSIQWLAIILLLSRLLFSISKRTTSVEEFKQENLLFLPFLLEHWQRHYILYVASIGQITGYALLMTSKGNITNIHTNVYIYRWTHVVAGCTLHQLKFLVSPATWKLE